MEQTSNTTTTTTTTTTASGSSASASSLSRVATRTVSSIRRISSGFFAPSNANGDEEGTELRSLRSSENDASGSSPAVLHSRSNSPSLLEDQPPAYADVPSDQGPLPPGYAEVMLLNRGPNPFVDSPPVRSSRRRTRLITFFCLWEASEGCGARMTFCVLSCWLLAFFFLFIRALQCSAVNLDTGSTSCTSMQKILFWLIVVVIWFSMGYFFFESRNISLKRRLWQLIYACAYCIGCCTLLIVYGLMSHVPGFNIAQNASNAVASPNFLGNALGPLIFWICVLFLFVCRSYFRVIDSARR